MRIRINKRTVLTIVSAVSFIASGIHLWRSRHKIDAVLDDTREARHSEDKEVKKEANWTCVKRIAPIVAPVAVGAVVGIASACGVHASFVDEMNQARATIDTLGRAVVREPVNELNSRYESEHRDDITLTRYVLAINGEEFWLPRDGIDDFLRNINKMIKNDLNANEYVNLGGIRYHLGHTDSLPIDETFEWLPNDEPELRVRLPRTGRGMYGDELIWEIYIDATMHVIGDGVDGIIGEVDYYD